jgi:hypothetical protein
MFVNLLGSGAELRAMDYLKMLTAREAPAYLPTHWLSRMENTSRRLQHRLSWKDGKVHKLQLFADFGGIASVIRANVEQ